MLPFWHNLSAITTIPLALLTKRRRAKFSVEEHRIQGVRSIRFDCPLLDVPKLSGPGTAASQLSLAPLMFNLGTRADSTKNR
jgi:hypothetical protein